MYSAKGIHTFDMEHHRKAAIFAWIICTNFSFSSTRYVFFLEWERFAMLGVPPRKCRVIMVGSFLGKVIFTSSVKWWFDFTVPIGCSTKSLTDVTTTLLSSSSVLVSNAPLLLDFTSFIFSTLNK
mmetsp:Transcript_24075/g.34980  ORF Transcript_24075/g.34980 Transcript_24075/m.34980 type:complete len:125 (+) Transcript_24075:157-531(+)